MDSPNAESVCEIPEELLLCGICQNNLKNPKQLKCLHTFCEDCIDELCTQNQQNHKPKCPICHTVIYTSTGIHRDDLFINSLMATLSVEETSAVNCAKHPDEELNLYCVNCREVVCESCCSSQHIECFIDTIPQGIEQLCHEKEHEARENLNVVKEVIEDTCQDLLNQQEERTKKKEEIANAISEYFHLLRDDVQRLLRDRECQMLQHLEDSFIASNNIEMNKVSWCRSMLAMIGNKEQFLDVNTANGYTTSNKAISALKTYEELQCETSRGKRVVEEFKPGKFLVQFTPNKEKIQELLNTEAATLVVKSVDSASPQDEYEESASGYTEPGTVYSTSRGLPLQYADSRNKFLAVLPDDKRKGYIVGLAWIGDDRLVAVDRWNKSMKLFTCDGVCTAVMSFSNVEPWDVAVMKTKKSESVNAASFCLVVLPAIKSIKKIMVPVEGRLEVSAKIATVVGYTCVAHNSKLKTLVCGVCPPFGYPRVDIIKITGIVLKSFAVDSLQKYLFSYPRSIDVIEEDDSFVVCDWNKNSVMFIRQDGFILGSYRGSRGMKLKDPVGTATDSKGFVMVADKKSNCIHIVRPGGEFVGTMIAFAPFQGPCEINISHGKRPRLAVSYGPGFVEIFDLFDFDPAPPPLPPSLDIEPSAPPPPPPLAELPSDSFETTL